MILFKILDNTETDQNWKIGNKFGTDEIGEDSKEEKDDQGRIFGDIPLFNVTYIYDSAIAPDALAVLLVIYLNLSLSLSLSLSLLIYGLYFSHHFAIAPDALAVLLVSYFYHNISHCL